MARTPQIAGLTSELGAAQELSREAQSQVALLNQQLSALRTQIAALEQALEASEVRDTESRTAIADLGRRLNVALAQRVADLSRYRSDFFGRLREILEGRADIRVVGDRFVFQSEVLFDPGQAVINPEGTEELAETRQARSTSSPLKSRPTSPGFSASTATPTSARSRTRSSPATGSSRRRAPSRSRNI